MTAVTANLAAQHQPVDRPSQQRDAADRLGHAEQLRALLDPAFLAGIRWDAGTQVFVPPPEHPQLGYRICAVLGCPVATHGAVLLCPSCAQRYRKTRKTHEIAKAAKAETGMAEPTPHLAADAELAAYIAAGRPASARLVGEFFCAVPGCERTMRTCAVLLCSAHHAQQVERLPLPTDAFIHHPDVKPLPGLGSCLVLACVRVATTRRGLCRAHIQQWNHLRRRSPDTAFAAWCRVAKPVMDGVTVVLRGLPELVQLQVLYGLQVRTQRGTKTGLFLIRELVQLLRERQITSLLDPDAQFTDGRRVDHRRFAGELRILAGRAFATPDTERRKDVWEMGVFGLGNANIDYRKLTQPWLRAAVQNWVFEEIPTRYGNNVAGCLRAYVNSMAWMSDSLRLHRHDHGDDPAALGRADVVVFLNRLAHLEAIGKLSNYQRITVCRHVALLLRECRALGLTRPGGPMVGLADDFALRVGDTPKEPDGEEGLALPPEILEQLTRALPLMEQRASREVRVAVELLMHTGRRPNEVFRLPWDCLVRDADGKYALIWSNLKKRRIGRRLPINDATATLIRDQQHAVRTRFPDTPIAELALLPRTKSNPTGTARLTYHAVSTAHRKWIKRLPPLLLRDDQGRDVEFDKHAVVLYAYRRSYAQRHADAGTPVELLCELMDHRSMNTTRGYYNVTVKRTRAAVDKLAAFHFDGRGNRVWRQARDLLEHEHQRRAVGQVAVPFGICTEPSNVKAGGHACPFRFRCVGCGHFRSDPSYLPELRGYLDLLLRNRERVRAAAELEEWARAEAMPSDEETSRLRALIRRAETDLEQLSEQERRQIDEACRVVRTTRQTVHLGMPTIRPPDLDPNLQDLA